MLDPWEVGAVVVIILAGVFVALRIVRAAGPELADEEPTVLERPVANRDNGPLYAVMCGVTAQLARNATVIEDIAETIRIEKEKVKPSLYDRLAAYFEDGAVVHRCAAKEVLDVKPQEA